MPWETQLRKWLQKCNKVVILGIGNPLRGDDALGLEILLQLRGKVPRSVRLIDSGTMPENFTGEVKRFRPSHVLLIDAAYLNAKPGGVRLVPPEDIGGVAVSTHTLPLSMFAEVVQKNTKAMVLLLGVQPKEVEFVEGLTPELEKAVHKIAEVLMRLLGEVCG